MSSLQDTPQQALAGWLHQRGGEKAIEKMAEDLSLAPAFVVVIMDTQSKRGDSMSNNLAVSIALYTDGAVIFPNFPDWAVEKMEAVKNNALNAAKYKLWRDSHG